eukprot:RCo048555
MEEFPGLAATQSPNPSQDQVLAFLSPPPPSDFSSGFSALMATLPAVPAVSVGMPPMPPLAPPEASPLQLSHLTSEQAHQIWKLKQLTPEQLELMVQHQGLSPAQVQQVHQLLALPEQQPALPASPPSHQPVMVGEMMQHRGLENGSSEKQDPWGPPGAYVGAPDAFCSPREESNLWAEGAVPLASEDSSAWAGFGGQSEV